MSSFFSASNELLDGLCIEQQSQLISQEETMEAHNTTYEVFLPKRNKIWI